MSGRIALDYYPTPAWVVHRLLDRVPIGFGVTFLEPCAGDGAIVRAVRSWSPAVIGRSIGFDLNIAMMPALSRVVDHAYCLDALEADAPPGSTIVTNPPYKYAEQFVRRFTPQVERSFWLLRLGFLAAAKRASWLSELRPNLYVLPNRPKFRPNKRGKPGVDMTDYAWFEFPGMGRWEILDVTGRTSRTASGR